MARCRIYSCFGSRKDYQQMLEKLRKTINRHYRNLSGWKTNRKIIVIESDDWGSIRMPSKEVYELFISKGFPIDTRVFEQNDTLASNSDLELLFSSLLSIKNSKGQSPIITANVVMANPDFEKIKESKFEKYYYESFVDTLNTYYPEQKVFDKWKQGIKQKVFYPQFHAREHYNIAKWMQLLRSGSKDDLEAFSSNMVGIPSKTNPELGNQLQIALGVDGGNTLDNQKAILEEGLSLFESVFGFQSKSFIAPVYTWHSDLNPFLAQKGVKFLQGGKIQNEPLLEGGYRKIKHFLGEKNKLGQYYLVRNVYFEPTTDLKKNWVDECFKDISAAFLWKNPVIMSTHRLNYVSGINKENGKNGVSLLYELLLKVVNKYPDVEFMTSDQLGELIKSSK